MISDFIYELKIHRVLKMVARQRVTAIFQPGNAPLIERAITLDEKTQALLLTAEIRGWVETLHENIETTKINANGNDIEFNEPSQEKHWKLTDSGWAAIQRRHQMAVLTLVITLIGVYVAIKTT